MRLRSGARRGYWAKLVLAILASGACVTLLGSQEPVPRKPPFEVASIKPNKTGSGATMVGVQSCRFVATNAPLRMLVQYAYRPVGGQLPSNQIIGGPDWANSDRFDVQAKLEEDTRSISPADMQLLVQSLLEDRFQLKAHRETRELPVYDLVVAKDGPKMKLSEDQTPLQQTGLARVPCVAAPLPPPPPPSAAGQRGGPGMPPRGAPSMIAMPGPDSIRLALTTNAMPVSSLIPLLQQYAGRPIIDKTNLDGLYDARLEFGMETGNSLAAGPQGVAPPLAADPGGAPFFTAIQEQLGLKLEPSKGPVDVVIIESVQKPSEN
jgi:uncharacterized protein (TIGR03435 family)